ncbi:hypothetical protein TrRE_jg2252 [Triparma retinervis]|uniref:Uncharacterized protein n=1 Tax=Triparma retinervis TaxID=2557542 RepID=A0A9W7A555_9STRA|nr:hypothetical protein TrRE_jg2252 [Triparma retinervis]
MPSSSSSLDAVDEAEEKKSDDKVLLIVLSSSESQRFAKNWQQICGWESEGKFVPQCDESEVAQELLKQKVESLKTSLAQQKRVSEGLLTSLQASKTDAEKIESSIRMERGMLQGKFEELERTGSTERKRLEGVVDFLQSSQESLKKALSSIEGRQKETTEELAKVKTMGLSSSSEVVRLGKANRELEADCGLLRNKNTSSEAELSSLRQLVKSLRTELSQTGTELTKRTLEVTHAEEKMKMVQDALQDSKALVKATSDAASAEAKRSNATVDVISTLRTENVVLNEHIGKLREENSEEISKLNGVIANLDVEKRRIEIVSSNLAEQLHAAKGEIHSPPPYAYPNAPAPRYAPLELREVDLDSIASSLPVTPVSKRKADRDAEEDQTATKKKKKKKKKKKVVGASDNPNCAVCNLQKFGLMVACKPVHGDPCPHGSHCHVGCADPERVFVCDVCVPK